MIRTTFIVMQTFRTLLHHTITKGRKLSYNLTLHLFHTFITNIYIVTLKIFYIIYSTIIHHPYSFFITTPVFDHLFHQITTRSVNLEGKFIQISTNVCNKYTLFNTFSPDLTSTIHVHESNKNYLIPDSFFADSSSST